MTLRRWMAAWLVVMITSAAAAAATPLDRYHEQQLRVRSSFWDGVVIERNGAPVELGFLGSRYDDVFEGSEAALEAGSTYHAMKTGGFVAYVAGMTTLVTVLVLVSIEHDSMFDTTAGGLRDDLSPTPLFWGLLAGGTAVGLTGGILMQSANGYLTDGVHLWNDDLYRSLGGGAATSARGPALQLRWRGTF